MFLADFRSSRFCGAARYHNRKQHPARARAKEVGSMLVELGVVEVVTVVLDVIVFCLQAWRRRSGRTPNDPDDVARRVNTAQTGILVWQSHTMLPHFFRVES